MNEFIVWDKFREEFTDDLTISGININEALEENEDWICFPWIGLKDTEGNKIYADSSIVELKMIINKVEVIIKGYFSYIKEELRYEFYQYFNQRQSFIKAYLSPRDSRITENFKIIDTIQENKLGLIERQEYDKKINR